MRTSIGDEDIREFADIWREEFHEKIPPDVARERASQLMELYALIAGFPPTQVEQFSASPSGTGKP